MGEYDFKFKPFEEMTKEDYERVGFMSGLEVHQQLLTKRKLFCRCPAGKYTHDYNAEILRHMRPTLSELGEYDGTALMEFKTKKNIIYRIHYDSVCTYEMDDTPPFMIDEQALDIALEVGMLLDANLVDELHIARKQYLDGSIPTGFQRTAITCVNGKIPYKDGEIDITHMSIEEDSCREEDDSGHTRIYITDRLGMPLIETVTAPQMKTPVQVAEVNEILRRLARSTGHVRTGIGASRQDVNVSVRGGTRIEIKGVYKIPLIPRLTYNEAFRQWSLLQIKEELENRGITSGTFEAEWKDVTKFVKKTRYQPISDAVKNGQVVNCVTLRGFKNILTKQTQTDTYFSKEISDRVRVIACLTNLPNIVHSDNPAETLAASEWQKLKKHVGATEKDTLVLVWGNEEDAEMGASEIIIRAKEATMGVPSETRQALQDGTTGFERILPGPERMYPDTDLPPKKITEERKDRIREQLPERFWIRENRYRKLGVPEDLIKYLAISEYAPLFDKLTEDMKVDPALAATALIQYPKRLKKKRLPIGILNQEIFEKIFDAYKAGKLPKDGILHLMEKTLVNGFFSEDLIPEQADEKTIENDVQIAVRQFEEVNFNNPERKDKYIMGEVMDKLRMKADGSEVRIILEKKLSEVK